MVFCVDVEEVIVDPVIVDGGVDVILVVEEKDDELVVDGVGMGVVEVGLVEVGDEELGVELTVVGVDVGTVEVGLVEMDDEELVVEVAVVDVGVDVLKGEL